jgi:hypothetical protein
MPGTGLSQYGMALDRETHNMGKVMKVDQKLQSDVIVVGGGSSAIGAAVAAARTGAKVSLIEKFGFLGGTASAGMVSVFQIGPKVSGQPVIRGIFQEIQERLDKYDNRYGTEGRRFNPEMYKLVAYDMCEEAGVDLLLNTYLHEVIAKDRRVEKIVLSSKSGPIDMTAKIYIDASGDGDLSAWAGAEFEIGAPPHGLQQPMTLMFTVGNVDIETVARIDSQHYFEMFQEMHSDATTSRGRFIFFVREGYNDLMFCTVHICGADGTDVAELTKAERDARRETFRIYDFFKAHVPGCKNAVLTTTAPMLGVRETRRIRGDYVLTRDDIVSGRRFEDTIARSTSWLDLHNPRGEGVLHEYLRTDTWFEIPLRCLIVKGMDNLLVAGRCISTSHLAAAATRETPTCIATGQAAGVTAAIAAKDNICSRDVPYDQIRDSLVHQQADLGQ